MKTIIENGMPNEGIQKGLRAGQSGSCLSK